MSFDKKYLPELENLPEEMSIDQDGKGAIRQWVCWKSVTNPKKGKADKVPINVHTGGGASTTNPATWGTFWNALNFYRAWYGREHSHTGTGGKVLTGPISGLGFVLTPPWIGFDLDGCVEKGRIEPWAQEIIDMIGSYTEISPSGTGIRIFAKGHLPPGRNRNGKIEVYQQGRFLTVTGRVLPGMEAVKAYAQ